LCGRKDENVFRRQTGRLEELHSSTPATSEEKRGDGGKKQARDGGGKRKEPGYDNDKGELK